MLGKNQYVHYEEEELIEPRVGRMHRPPVGLVQCSRCDGTGVYEDQPKSMLDDILARPVGDWWAKASPGEKVMIVIVSFIVLVLAFFGVKSIVRGKR